ncbi:glycosyltransferase [Flavobacterium daejeonense]|uniref:glycosyltransferase n=1 Tax=Flavobacterium daejeonense TaxID=350893 RepID=UPI00054D73C4|nr:glycosyltransferase family 2 protein [Flavobacterium daejeonense]
MKLTILIPTYNRVRYLKKNIEMLDYYITNNELENTVKILVSNNFSTDETRKTLEILKSSIKSELIIYNQNLNIGLEKNALFVLEKCETPFVMYLGDDDYIKEEYLVQVIKSIEDDNKIGCIIPSYISVDYEGNELIPRVGRDFDLPTKLYLKGFSNCLENSIRGHQLSGLVLKNEGLFRIYKEQNVNNLYPFIYFTSYCCLNYSTLHLTFSPVYVTAAIQKDKDWGYGKDGLIPHIFDNYQKIKGISYYQKFLLQKKVIVSQSWRYFIYLQHGKINFIRSLFLIIISKRTNWITKFYLPVFVTMFYFNSLGRKLRVKSKIIPN